MGDVIVSMEHITKEFPGVKKGVWHYFYENIKGRK